MAPEDLEQIRAIVTTAVDDAIKASEARMIARQDASEARMIARQDAMLADLIARQDAIAADLTARQDAIAADLIARQGRAIEAIGQEMSAMRAEFNTRFNELSRRIDVLSERLDTLANVVISIDARQSALLRAIDTLQVHRGQSEAILAAQQKAIDSLAERITKIERELHPGRQQ